MQVEYLKSNSPLHPSLMVFLGLTIISATITIPVTTTILNHNSNPTGTYLSPLPQGTLTSATPTPKELSFQEKVNYSQNYFQKAYLVAQKDPQTPDDQKNILTYLNQSLNYANDAINTAPTDPLGFVLRANILNGMSSIDPKVVEKAKEDLATAEKLSNGKLPVLPNTINPIDLIPQKQARNPINVPIAAPNNEATKTAETTANSNAKVKTVTLPANQIDLTINDSDASEESYIYLVPKTKTNNPITVKSKAKGTFTISSTNAEQNDLTLDYWIINP